MPDDKKAADNAADKAADKATENGVSDSDKNTTDKEAKGLFDQERDALYANYYGEEDGGDSDGQDQKPDNDQDGDHDTDSDADDKGDADDDKSDGKGDDHVADKDDKDQKMVPLAALHEERKKRQDLSVKVDDQSDKIRQLLEDNTKLLEQLSKRTVKGDDDDGDYDVDDDELDAHDKAVKKELEDLKKFKQKQEEKEQKVRADEAQKKLDENIAKVSAELEEEGFPGFDVFGVHAVASKMRQKLMEVGVEKIKEYDNPEGWKKVYKEEIFPDISKRYHIQKTEVVDDKEDRVEKKKKAKLPNKPNKPAMKKDDDKEQSEEEAFADYMKRRKAQLFD